MAEIDQEETQQELFVEFAGAAKRPERFIPQPKVNKPILLNTSVEQIILAGIALILVCCFVFFLGVIRGKSLNSKGIEIVSVKKEIVAQIPAQTPPKTVSQPLSLNPANRVVSSPISKEPETANSKPYTIQLSTYKKRDLAEKEVVVLRHSGYYSTIIQSDDYYQVCVGQYATKDEAKKDLKIFSAKYRGCYLRRR